MKAKYALRALCELARVDFAPGDGRRLSARTLAERSHVPGKFLESILVELRQADFIDSLRGQHGGHALARPAEQIAIGDVIRAIDGPLAPVRCASVTAYQRCTDCPDPDDCNLRTLMREARDALSQVLDQRSLRDFANTATPLLAPHGETP